MHMEQVSSFWKAFKVSEFMFLKTGKNKEKMRAGERTSFCPDEERKAFGQRFVYLSSIYLLTKYLIYHQLTPTTNQYMVNLDRLGLCYDTNEKMRQESPQHLFCLK